MLQNKDKVIIAINNAGTIFAKWLKETKNQEAFALISEQYDVLKEYSLKYKIFADKNCKIEEELLQLKKEIEDENIYIVLSLSGDYSDLILKKFLNIFKDKLNKIFIIAVMPFNFEGEIKVQQSKKLLQFIELQNLNFIEISYQKLSENDEKGMLVFDFIKQVNELIYSQIKEYKFNI